MIQILYDDSKQKFRIYTDYENGRAYVKTYEGEMILDMDIQSKPHKYKLCLAGNNSDWIEVPEHFDLLKQIENILHPDKNS